MIKFSKMHGAGNDFVVIDGRFDNTNPSNYSKFAESVCHRKFGIGADGLLVVKNSKNADTEMVYYNADGSRAAMCGNGIRCFSKFIYENNIIDKTNFTVDTLDGVKNIELNINNKNTINSVKVSMGKANFNPSVVPVLSDKDYFIEEKILVLDKEFIVSSVLMGVTHTVIFVDELNKDTVLKYGPLLETHKVFPKKSNINFVKVVDRETIHIQTWERGCGYTLACGTGITASVIIANKLGKTDNIVKAISEGGEILIEIDNENTYMIGSATTVFNGELNTNELK